MAQWIRPRGWGDTSIGGRTRCSRKNTGGKGYTVEPLYNEVLGTMKITLLYQVSHYIRVKKQRNIKSWDQQNYLVIRGFCYIRPRYNEVPLYPNRYDQSCGHAIIPEKGR